MATGLEEVVSPPPLLPPIVGLLQAAEVVNHAAGDDRWFAGITWQPSNNTAAETVEVGWCASTFAFATTATYTGPGVYSPFAVVAHDLCSTFIARDGFQGYRDRVLAVLSAKEWGDVEAEFERGTIISANPHLASNTATFPAGGNVTTTPVLSPKDALAVLDEAIAKANIGLGMIHAPAYVVSQWVTSRAVKFSELPGDIDNLDLPILGQPAIFSPNGNIIVAGSGYQGYSPAGTVDSTHAVMWAYATDLVTVHREATPTVLPDPSEPAAHNVDTLTNTVNIRAYRTYAIEWSKALHAAVKVNTTLSASSGSGGGLTDAELRATAVPVSGPLTDTQLRASAVPISGALTDTQLRASAVPVSGPLTDTQLRATSVPTAPVAGENHLGQVGGQISVVGVELTRPSDTTAYAALDVISDSTSAPTLITFTNVARVNTGSGYITKARLMTDQKTCTARFRLHLFHTAPTAINDNSPYLKLYANAANRIGEIDFPATYTEDATNSTAASSHATPGTGNLPLSFLCASTSRTIYGILEVRDAFTPASGQKFYIELSADLN